MRGERRYHFCEQAPLGPAMADLALVDHNRTAREHSGRNHRNRNRAARRSVQDWPPTVSLLRLGICPRYAVRCSNLLLQVDALQGATAVPSDCVRRHYQSGSIAVEGRNCVYCPVLTA